MRVYAVARLARRLHLNRGWCGGCRNSSAMLHRETSEDYRACIGTEASALRGERLDVASRQLPETCEPDCNMLPCMTPLAPLSPCAGYLKATIVWWRCTSACCSKSAYLHKGKSGVHSHHILQPQYRQWKHVTTGRRLVPGKVQG